MHLITKKYKETIFNFKKKINLDKKKLKYNNLEDLFNYFGTDKGSKVLNQYSSLKKRSFIKGHNFAKFYEKNLKKIKNKKINILEIGVWKGASTASFFYYFPNANFISIDRNFKFIFSSKRINFFFCDTTIDNNLKKLAEFLIKKKVTSFDIIIDDSSHILSDILKNFIFFFKFLKSKCIYIIEDYKHPNYFSHLNDNKHHFLVDKVLSFIKKKKLFKSTILNQEQIKYLISNVKKIRTYKGSCKSKNGKNISDIAFIYKK
jgi:hypothetical protein